MMALEGIPAFYVHSLLGTENDLALQKETGRARSINRHVWDLDELNKALGDEHKHHKKLLNELTRRMGIRANQKAFHPNATQYTLHFSAAIFAFWRESIRRDQNIFALHNVSDQPQSISLVELNLIATDTWRELLSGDVYQDLEATIVLPPYGCMWITNK